MRSLFYLLLFVIGAAAVQAEPQSPADIAMARMRDAMKKLTQRIAEADAATATAQAAQIAAEAKVADLEGKIKTLTLNLKDETTLRKSEQAKAEKAAEDAKAKLEFKDKQVVALTESLTKWKAGFEKARDVANAKEGEREAAAGKAVAMERKAQEHERKNREMYKLGMEILERYKSFGLGSALLAREPFVGSMKVKFQNYVQDYGDGLATQRIDAGKKEAVGDGTQTAKPKAKP
jgi:hypothetical protein